MSSVPNSGDPGWPALLPPDRDPRAQVVGDPAPDGGADPDDDLFAGWEPQRRVNRITVVLAACLLVVAGFAVGAVVAKRSAASTSGTAARSAGATGATGREGFGGFAGGAGGFRNGGAAGAGAGGAGGAAGVPGGTGAGAGAGAGAAGGGGGSTGTPVVVGTVTSVSATRITVKNFAGTTVVVRVAARTPVTTPGVGGLRKGQTVSVEGTRASDGSVTATAVVSRS
jgi:hypothetical protein